MRLILVGLVAMVSAGCGVILGLEDAVLVVPDQPDGSLGTPPGAPTGVTATAVAGGTFQLTWDAPSTAGTHPITGYSIESSPAGVSTTTTDTTFTTPALTLGTSYTFSVRAVSMAGPGAEGTSAPAVAGDVPAAPTGVVASTPETGRLRVVWNAANANGYPVTAYTVVVSPGGKMVTVDGATTLVNVLGMTNNTMYTATVTATNSFGVSAGAQSNAATAHCSPSGGYTLDATDSTWVQYGTPALDPTTAGRDIEPVRDNRGGANTDIVGWAKFGLGTIPAWATITSINLYMWVEVPNISGITSVLTVWYSANDGWVHGSGSASPPPIPTPAEIAATQAVSSTVAPGTMDGYQIFTVNVAARDWSADVVDRNLTLGLRNSATLTAGSFSGSIFTGQDGTAGHRPYLIVGTCE